MNTVTEESPFRTAILEWQKKHGVQDGDPALALLELCEIYLSAEPAVGQKDDGPLQSFEKFRSSIEQMDRLTKAWITQSGEIIQETRAFPKIRDDLCAFPRFAVIFSAALALLVGILLGRFVL
jgi:hypothetical protein